MSSGVQPSEDCLKAIKTTEANSKEKYRCIILRISDDNKEIIVDKLVSFASPNGPKVSDEEQKEEFDAIMRDLPEQQCRYLIMDLMAKNQQGALNQKLIIIHWAPDSAPVRGRMLSASSYDSLKKQASHITNHMQMNDGDDKNINNVLDVFRKL